MSWRQNNGKLDERDWSHVIAVLQNLKVQHKLSILNLANNISQISTRMDVYKFSLLCEGEAFTVLLIIIDELCLYSTFHLEYPLVLSRFYLYKYTINNRYTVPKSLK